MLAGWFVFLVSLAYLGLLFVIASYGDRLAREGRSVSGSSAVYVLSLAVYCTSWTFYGSVGLAAATGWNFLPIYIGPIIAFTAGWPVILRILKISKANNITSIADFIAARYGKSQGLAALVTVIAVLGTVPYIALQLKALATNFNVLVKYPDIVMPQSALQLPWWGDTALIVTLLMALFAALFGTRKIDATEHHEGMVLALAFESIVKLVAFLTVGVAITFIMFNGPSDLIARLTERPELMQLFTAERDWSLWTAMTLISMAAIICLPRQFHITVVENTDPNQVRKAAWLFPLYLVAINIFVVPIAIAGLLLFGPGTVDADTYVLAVPMLGRGEVLSLLAFLGGLSAATGMVIVATVALSTMVSNDLVVPFLLRRTKLMAAGGDDAIRALLLVRRLAIAVILAFAFIYYRFVGQGYALASIGLLSFAAVAQFAPAMILGLYWSRANRVGAWIGIGIGFGVWCYTLMLPVMADAGILPLDLVAAGPGAVAWLKPQHLFELGTMAPLEHGVFWSLLFNTAGLVLGSLIATERPVDRTQALAFRHATDDEDAIIAAKRWKGAITVGDLRELALPFVGPSRLSQAFSRLSQTRGYDVTEQSPAALGLIHQTERMLASVLGSASARLVMALSFERRRLNVKGALQLLDDASAAIQYNRSLLQSTLENVSQGIAVFDFDLRLVCRNQRFLDLQGLAPQYGQVGTRLHDIIRVIAEAGEYGGSDTESIIAERIAGYRSGDEYRYQRTRPNGLVLDVRTTPMPGTGVVATFTDITEQVAAEAALREANESLERRVAERTSELRAVNEALRHAKADAEQANLSKTRFLAAASHDLLQPLNATRLFIAALSQRPHDLQSADLLSKAEASLTAVDDLLTALLDIAKLDAHAVPPKIQDFPIRTLMDPLRLEFGAMAERAGLRLATVSSDAIVRSDPKLLRRILQNFLSNAVRYTPHGRVLFGCRRVAGALRIEVWDTGPGIAESKLGEIFKEFHRLAETPSRDPGIGLGLAIVDRIARTLDHEITVRSWPGRGTMFAATVPLGDVAAVRVDRRPASILRDHRSLGGRRVLCIDNDEAILDGMNAVLSRWGCVVLKARGLSEARAVLSGTSPDLILADYHLASGVTGIDVIETLRRESAVVCPAVVVTADRSDEVRSEAEGFSCLLLNKPVRPGALRAVMMRALAEGLARPDPSLAAGVS